jgi:cytosine/adenosine deaminase-related metal-dependent hydrolase
MSEPGLVNAHTHVYSGLAPFGMPVPAARAPSFVQILERVWWRLDRALDAASLRAAARYYVSRALLAGTTAIVDHHESPSFIEGSLDVIADACDELGIAAVLSYGATERNGGREEARRGLAECRRFLRDNRRPLVRGVIGLHASFTVSDDTILECAELARELRTVVHVHVAEAWADVDDARARGYTGPLERLLRLRALPRGSILAHGVNLSAAEVARAADAGLWIVQNPRSNRQNRVGYPRHLVASQRVALGTDGFPSDMADELGALRAEASARRDDRSSVEARLPAGRALVKERLGAPLDDAVDRAGPLRKVRDVTIAGRAVVRDHALTTADARAIEEEARAEAKLLWPRMEAL